MPQRKPVAVPNAKDEELQARIENLCPAARYPRAEHPIRYAITSKAANVSIEVLEMLSPNAPEPPSREDVLKHFAEQQALLEVQLELQAWLEPPILSPIDGRIRNTKNERDFIAALEESGRSAEQILSLAKCWNPTRGRPKTTQLVALDALDMWLTHPRWSWRTVTRKVCKCGQAEHDQLCQERLRQQINDLRKCLKKYGIPEPRRSQSV